MGDRHEPRHEGRDERMVTARLLGLHPEARSVRKRDLCSDGAVVVAQRLSNRTVPLFVSAPPPAVSCGTLGSVKAPTLVVGGEQSRRFYSLINEAVVRCTPTAAQ